MQLKAAVVVAMAAAAEVEAMAAVVDMLVAAADMPAAVAATRTQPAAVAVVAVRAQPVAAALRGTSVPHVHVPQVHVPQVRAVIDLRSSTLPRIMPSAERRRSMQPGTQRAMQTGP